ncbi:MAG TPA: zf-HC2 domain-containing protein, partial [Candidatus Dormibacteraeota bacterium]|nr:zf-HC2 domain-containing protein [Candidatus Dormibacteraeota bacterium]
MIHLTPQQLSSYMDGELNEVSTELVRRHMGMCEECTLKFAALEEQEEQLLHALVHEPGDDFFDRFAGDVERLLPASGSRRGSSSPASRAAAIREAARKAAKDAGRNAARESTPARAPAPQDAAALTPFGAAQAETSPPAAIPQPMPEPALIEEGLPLGDESDLDADETLAALSVGRMTDEPPSISRPSPARRPAPALRSRERKAPSPPPRARAADRPPQRPKVRRPAPSIPWYVALILAAIAGAAGVVASRTDPVSAWLDAHGLRSLFPSPERAVPAEPELQAPPREQSAPTPEVREPQTSDNPDASAD